MKKSSAICMIGLTSLLGFVLMGRPLAGQSSPRIYEVFRPTPQYYEAMELVRQAGDERQQGVTALLSLAQQNPNTTLGATCLFDAAAYCGKRSEAIPLYQRIANEYPNSGFELQARLALVNLQTTTTAQWFSAADALLRTYGAPTLAEITQNQGRAVNKLRALPLDYQHGLISFYTQFKEALQSPNIHRHFDAVALSYFGREAFFYDEGSTAHFTSGIIHNIVQLNGGDNAFEGDVVPPKLAVRSPHRGRVGPRPRIRFETTLRDAHSCTVTTRRSRFSLDGQDVASQVRVRAFRINPTARKNQIFEQLLFEFQPSQPLAVGEHHFSAVLLTEGDPDAAGPGVVRFSLPLNVRAGEPDCDDDLDDDQWEEDV